MTSSAAPRARSIEPAIARRLDDIWREAYGARGKDDLLRLYERWAATYDEDHEEIGFFGHRLTAEVLARHLTRHDSARVLDAGAGTGAAGEALAALGFRNVDAIDFSAPMLERAARKGVYREVVVGDLALPIDAFNEQSFDAAVMVGVFSYGQAPAEALDEVLRLVRQGGILALTMRTDYRAEDPDGVVARIEALERRGVLHRVEETDAFPYLPHKDPDARFRVWAWRVTAEPTPEVEAGFEDAVREAFEAAAADGVVELDHAWIWDSRASRLYERYTRTAGYYLTDCEEEILRAHAVEIAGAEPVLVELGCGSARKISHLLRARVAARPAPDGRPDGAAQGLRYVPIDVSPGALTSTAAAVREAFGGAVHVAPEQGLFEDVVPRLPAGATKRIFFFGSSIGNIESLAETAAFLEGLRAQLGPDDRLVVGIDLHKDEDVLERAYNEEEACRAFFVHMLRRVNEHLDADFDPRVFELASTYEEEEPWRGVRTRRMNLRVAPRRPQHTWVQGLDMEVRLGEGQPVQVGMSRKFEPAAIGELARLAGFRLARQWFDRRRWFSLNELAPDIEAGDVARGGRGGGGSPGPA